MSGANIIEVIEILNQANLKSTTDYLRTLSENKKKAMENLMKDAV
jgi:hypothetical protein